MPEQPEKNPRIYLAAERTLLAWIRTGLAMMGFGFVVARFGLFLRELQDVHQSTFPNSSRLSLWFGIALVFMGVAANIWAAYRHMRLVGDLRRGAWTPDQGSRSGVAIAVGLACIGVAVAVYLLVR